MPRSIHALLVALLAFSSLARAQDAAPVVVIPVPGAGLTEPVANAVMQTIPSGLQPMVERREVRALADGSVVAAILQCEGDAAAPCIGAQIANAGASAGVLVRVSRAAADGPVQLRLEVYDAITGAPRGEPIDVEVPAEAATDPAQMVVALNPTFAAMRSSMPAPPQRASLLLAINVDGAAVAIDGEAVGESPLAPVEVTPGSHTISVTRRGFTPFNRSVEVTLDGARLNLELEPVPEIAQRMEQEDAAEVDSFVTGEAPSDDPIYTKWWLWAAVGGAVVLITAIAVGVAVAGGGGGNQGFEVPPIPQM